jgi:hypothetical protein
MPADARWPSLPLDDWRDTKDTLHMWTQIAGKICLALTAARQPLLEHRVPGPRRAAW